MTESEELLLRVLTEEHWPCPVCGYDLHRTTAPRCSECGHRIELRVTVALAMGRAWLTTLLVAAGQAGLGVFVILLALSPLGERRLLLPPGLLWDGLYYAIFGLIPTPVLLLVLRRRFSRLPEWLQWGSALAFGAILGTTLAGLVMTIR